MKALFVILAFLCFNAQAATTWVTSSEIHTALDNSKGPIPIFINSYAIPAGPPNAVWLQIDLKPFGVTADAKAAFLTGLLIISHGTTAETCDLQAAFRAPGSSLSAGNYIGQTIEAATADGQRSNMSTWVPLVNGVFEFQWNRNTYSQWPTECSYGINLSLQAWVR